MHIQAIPRNEIGPQIQNNSNINHSTVDDSTGILPCIYWRPDRPTDTTRLAYSHEKVAVDDQEARALLGQLVYARGKIGEYKGIQMTLLSWRMSEIMIDDCVGS